MKEFRPSVRPQTVYAVTVLGKTAAAAAAANSQLLKLKGGDLIIMGTPRVQFCVW